MANSEHLELLRQGVEVWNAWRAREPSVRPAFYRADLSEARLAGGIPSGANQAQPDSANLRNASLSGADLVSADLSGADLSGADLGGADLTRAILGGAILWDANLSGANLREAILSEAQLDRANLSGANLSGATLLETNLVDAVLTGSRVYGVSAWNVKLSQGTKQQDLVITSFLEPEVTVDNIEVAQFVYLLLNNAKIRDVIDTVGKKGVLLLGRFTEGRIAVLERLREELRKRDYVPIVFNFDKPDTKDFTETVRLLAKFVIADITNPKSAPLELQATVLRSWSPSSRSSKTVRPLSRC
jgi:uncharacterized protein YjbI with pentapeptide repeats